MTTMNYLHSLEGKPGHDEEYARLRDTLCEADRAELENNLIGLNTKIIWNSFNKQTIEPVLLVQTDNQSLKLVHWDGHYLRENNGKMYTWAHNPYTFWTGIEQ